MITPGQAMFNTCFFDTWVSGVRP